MQRPSSEPALKLQNVSKQYGTKLAVQNIDFSVNKGEVYGFLGPNGAGKTTTIRMIMGALRPTAGAIQIFGEDSAKVAATHTKIGFLSGDMAFESDLTGAQYLEFVANQYIGTYGGRLQQLAARLEADLHIKISNYSRGNRQKIGLIAALFHEPELLILDEPTSGFDPLVQETFVELIRDYSVAGGTVFMSSHILSEVQLLCDRVAFIRDGAIVGIKEVAALARAGSKTIHVMAASSELAKLKKASADLAGLSLLHNEGAGLRFSYNGTPQPLLAHLAKYKLQDVVIQEPELDEAFMAYYNHEASNV